MNNTVLHKPFVDEELYNQDLHIHTKRMIYIEPLDLSTDTYIGSYDAYIDPFDFLIMLSKIKYSQKKQMRKQIKKIAFVDHGTLIPFEMQESLKNFRDGLDLEIHFGIEIAAKIECRGRDDKIKLKRVHLIVYDLKAENKNKINEFLLKLERKRTALLRYMFDEFCNYYGLYIIMPEEVEDKVRKAWKNSKKNIFEEAEEMQKLEKLGRMQRFEKTLKELTTEELEELNEWKIRLLTKGSDVYGSILRFAAEIKRHPKNLEFFLKTNEFNNEQDIINLLINSFRERIDDGFIETADVIKFSQQLGGTVVLAHPGKTKVTTDVIRRLINQGLNGIEVFHPDNRGTRDLLRIAKEKNIYITSGTDYHGHRDPNKWQTKYERVVRKLRTMINNSRKYNNEQRKTPDAYHNDSRIARNLHRNKV